MEILEIRWKSNVIKKAFIIFVIIFSTITAIPHEVEDIDPYIPAGFDLKYKIFSTRIDFETEYQNYTLLEIGCERKGKMVSHNCSNLDPCTNYFVQARVRYMPTDEVFFKPYIIHTDYEEPNTTINSILPFHNAIYVCWNSSNRNCISEIKVRAIGNDKEYELDSLKDDVIIENLQPCKSYRLYLTMKDVKGRVLSNLSEQTETSFIEPGPPNSVKLEVVENTANITWSPPEYATCVDFYYFMWTFTDCYKTDPEICLWSHENITSTEPRLLTINDLEGYQDYTLKININGDQINSSSYHEFSTPILMPGPVIGLTVASKFSTNLTVTWDPPKDNSLCVLYYMVFISNAEEAIEYKTTETSFLFDNLEPCAEYEINVASVSHNNITGLWARTRAKMEYDSPSRIRHEHIISYPSELKVEWDPPTFADRCIAHYRIAAWYMENVNKSVHIFDEATSELFVNIPQLISCVTYTIQIIAVTSSKETKEGLPAQFDATTMSRNLNEPSELEQKAISSKSIVLVSRNTDIKNNCAALYARFTCDASTKDAKIMHAETVFPIHNTRGYFSGTLEPVAPHTQYVCKVAIYNIAGWSSTRSAIFMTTKDYPEPPIYIDSQAISDTSLSVKWQEPRYSNGKLAMYKVYIQTVGPKYKIPSHCADIKFQALMQPVEASKTDFIFMEALPYVEYSIQVAAVNEIGVGEFSAPVKVTTKPSKSTAVTNFTVKTINGPELSETYKASVTLKWPLPCRANGEIIAFEGSFKGVRVNFPDEYFIWSVPINITSIYQNDSFEFMEDKLKPEYNFTVTITAVVKDAGMSDITTIEFSSPSGIPPKPDIVNNGDVNVFAAPNPTQSAFVRFSADILNSKMGQILFVALLVSETNCQADPEPKFALIESEKHWPEDLTWADVNNEYCIKQYQTTPIRWRPTIVTSRDLQQKRIIEYTIGDADHCRNEKGYCNGPLKPGVNYAVVVRLFTSSGYSDARFMHFKTDSQVQISFVLLLIISCLLSAFFLGFLYLWVTKKIVWHGEPFHGFEEHTGDISSKNFLEFYDEIAKSDKLHREYKELTAISNDLNLTNVASTSNETKNRYSNIFPYDKNRVILDCDCDGSDYINASFINGYKRRKEYIATQGPKPESFVDFWRMILQYNVRVVVMVTQLKEGDTVKCHQYFPYLNKELHFGHNITVSCKKETHYETYEKRELEIEHFSDCINQSVAHYFFRRWPDHDCPVDVTHLIDFVRKVKSEKLPSHSPIVVHCSAGVGRTGTFIGLDIIMQRLKSENRINIYETVKELRFQRMKMVQTVQQYQFLYGCAHHLVKKKHSSRHKKNELKKANAIIHNSVKNSSNGNGTVHAESIM